MPLESIDLNSPPVAAVNCDNQKSMGKRKWHKTRLEKFTKNVNIEFKNKNWQNGVAKVKNWKVSTIYLIIITVIIEIIVKMAVMVMNKDNNK